MFGYQLRAPKRLVLQVVNELRGLSTRPFIPGGEPRLGPPFVHLHPRFRRDRGWRALQIGQSLRPKNRNSNHRINRRFPPRLIGPTREEKIGAHPFHPSFSRSININTRIEIEENGNIRYRKLIESERTRYCIFFSNQLSKILLELKSKRIERDCIYLS